MLKIDLKNYKNIVGKYKIDGKMEIEKHI